MSQNLVNIVHPTLGAAKVPESSFRTVWSKRGYQLAEAQPPEHVDQGSQEADEALGLEGGGQREVEVPAAGRLGRRSADETGTGDSSQSASPGEEQ